ncbi:MAG: globin [Actinobacteria bacterium]|nr:globin [Actinomycetota bacterium]
MSDEVSLYQEVGGSDFFIELVNKFYEGVINDEVIISLYPDRNDFEGAKERLSLFLMQYWGGPTTYSEERGHPRLRQRHFPFAIGERERDHWLMHMQGAIDAMPTSDSVRTRLSEYMSNAAQHLVNTGQ